MISEYQQQLRDRFLSARVTEPPDPWRPVFPPRSPAPVGGLQGVGFAVDPTSGGDLLMAVSTQGHGVFDASSGVKVARDHEPELDEPAGPDLSCPGLGPLAGTSVRIAGVFGEGSTRAPMTGGVSTSSVRTGRITASCCPPAGARGRGRPESTGGMSSTPTTPNCGGSPRPGGLGRCDQQRRHALGARRRLPCVPGPGDRQGSWAQGALRTRSL